MEVPIIQSQLLKSLVLELSKYKKRDTGLLFRAKMASQAALSFDIFSLGKGGLDAYRKCSKDLNKLTDSGLNKDHLSKDVACAENPEQSSQAQLVADYRACVIHSVFAGASSILLPKPVKKALEGRFKGLTKGVKKGVGESGRMKEIEE